MCSRKCFTRQEEFGTGRPPGFWRSSSTDEDFSRAFWELQILKYFNCLFLTSISVRVMSVTSSNILKPKLFYCTKCFKHFRSLWNKILYPHSSVILLRDLYIFNYFVNSISKMHLLEGFCGLINRKDLNCGQWRECCILI